MLVAPLALCESAEVGPEDLRHRQFPRCEAGPFPTSNIACKVSDCGRGLASASTGQLSLGVEFAASASSFSILLVRERMNQSAHMRLTASPEMSAAWKLMAWLMGLHWLQRANDIPWEKTRPAPS